MAAGKIRRLQPRHPAVALERLDERGLFTDHVCTGSPVQHDVHAELGAADVAAHIPRGICLVERGTHTFLGERHFATDIQKAL
jgi:hypothetical protein